jgi:hypothetical protein
MMLSKSLVDNVSSSDLYNPPPSRTTPTPTPAAIESAILDPAPAADEIPMATRSFLLPLLSYFARVRLNIEVVLDVY